MNPQPQNRNGINENPDLHDNREETAEQYAYRTADEWAQGDPYLAAAQRALIDGSARKLLREAFKRSGMDSATLGAAVGHPARIAQRVVDGKEPLNATTVAAYLRAMDPHT